MMDRVLVLSLLIWGGVCLVAFGALNVLVPFRFLGLRRRRAGVGVAVFGIACMILGFVAPGVAARTAGTGQLIDRFVATDDFRERHWERIKGTPREIFAAIHAVSPNEVRGFNALMWMRSPRGGLSPEEKRLARLPILELMTRGNFVLLAERPGVEIVVGTIGQFWSGRAVPIRTPAAFRTFTDPRFAKVAMNFHVRDEGNGWCKVTTETRVACRDPMARRKFDTYWRVIYPGSAIIRAQWLQAIKRRTERARLIGTPTARRPNPGRARRAGT